MSATQNHVLERMGSYQRASQSLEEHILKLVMWVVPDPFRPEDNGGSFTMSSRLVATKTDHLLRLSGLHAIYVQEGR